MFCFSEFCRICLSKTKTLLNVNHLASDNVSYLNKLQFISPTLVEKQCNYMLLWICDKCLAQLNSAYKFLQNYFTSASFLEKCYLQLTNTNIEQNVCNNLIEESIENTIKKEKFLEDVFEIKDEQYFSESSITIVKHELSPVDLKTEIKFNDSTSESIYLEKVDFNFIANDETYKNGSDLTECSTNLLKNIPEHQVAESNNQNNITCYSDDFNDVIDNSNERSVNSSKLLPTNRSIKKKRRKNSTNLNRNKSAVNKEKTFECNISKKIFSQACNLKIHERFHTAERPFKCNVCPKKFNYSGNLRRHERVHTGERPYKCNMCPKKCNSSSDLKKHERLHSEVRPFKCNVCPKKFNYSGNLRKHERVHTGERPYICNMCPKKCNSSSDLKTHERLHSGVRPYKCNMCPKEFNQSGHLKMHERLHSGDRPYKCSVCPKTFYRSSHMKRHEIIHTEERPYKCNMCSDNFTQSTHLKRHKLTHSGELRPK